MSGLAFKGMPPTSDLRGSVAIKIATELKDLGYTLVLHDFVTQEHELQATGLGQVEGDFYALFRKADYLLILNNNSGYSALNNTKVSNAISKGFKIFDSWNVLDEKLRSELHLEVTTLGNYRLTQ